MLRDISGEFWERGEMIANGVWEAKRPESKSYTYVAKVADRSDGQLFNEFHFYKNVGCRFIADFITSGVTDDIRFLILKRYPITKPKLNVEHFCQITKALRSIHAGGYSHGDLKPENIVVDENQVVLIDFGLAYRFRRDGVHVKPEARSSRANTGTLEYMSLDAHQGLAVSARGDIENLGYLIHDLMIETLPWKATPEKTEIMKREWRESPIVGYARTLEYDEDVCYEHVKELILKLLC